ncbi:MAG TPA: hypothetical protein VMB21_13870 [Candidatus Limnocylindria bacterium]|jgi:hypothetical protein|nr:hypothetical protein [Candidatus Limnocylindria bacterium]
MSFRILWLALVALVATLPLRAELSERQLKALDGITRERFTARWTELGTNELAELRKRADAYMDELRDRHLVAGQVVSVRYTDTNRTAIERYEDLGDAAAWTGLALAMHAYRYAVTRDNRELVHDNPSLPAIRTLLDGVDTLLRVSGRPGYLPRFAGPAKDPAFAKVLATYGGADENRPGFGRLAFSGGTNAPGLAWLGGPSRDQYAALNFGFVTIWQLVRNDLRIRQRIATNVILMLDRIEADGGRLDDGQGHITFVTPALGAALWRTGVTISPDRFGAAYDRRASQFLGLTPTGMIRYGDSRPGLFTAFDLLSLSRLETNQTRRLLYQDRLSQLWRDCGVQLNPLVAACYVGAFERVPNDAYALATLQGMLSQFPDPPRWSEAHDNSTNAGILTVEVGGVKWAKFAQLVDHRPVAPFQWAQSAYVLSGGESAPVTHPGLDYLLAFWMGRDAGVIPSEDALPPLASTFPLRRGSNRTNTPSATNRLTLPRP